MFKNYYYIYVLSTDYVIHLLLKSNPRPKNEQINKLWCYHWNFNVLLVQSLFEIYHIEAYNSISSYNFVCISETNFHSNILEEEKTFQLNIYNLNQEDHPNITNREDACIYSKTFQRVCEVKLTNISQCAICEISLQNFKRLV